MAFDSPKWTTAAQEGSRFPLRRKETTQQHKRSHVKASRYLSSKAKAPKDSFCFLLTILLWLSPRLSGGACHPFQGEGCRRSPHSAPIGMQLLNNLSIPRRREETLCFPPFSHPAAAVVRNEWWCAKSLTGCLSARPHKSSRLLRAGPGGKGEGRRLVAGGTAHRLRVSGSSSLEVTVCVWKVTWLASDV